MGSWNFERWGIRISIVTIIVSTFLLLSRQGFYEYGLNITNSFQASRPSKTIKTIFNLISLLGNSYFVIGVLVALHLLTSRKLLSFVYLSYVIFNIYAISVEKQYRQEPRPYSYDHRIQALDWFCPSSFSLPSGHGRLSILLYQPIISDFIGNDGRKKGLLLWILITGGLVPFVSMQLGSHSIDQLLNGVSISLAALMLYKYTIQRQIYELMVEVLRGTSVQSVLLWNTILLSISLSFPLTIYRFNIGMKPQWTSFGLFLMNFACDKEWTHDDIQRKTGLSASIIGIVFGFVYGLSSFNKCSKIIFQDTSVDFFVAYLRGNWNFKGKLSNVCKYILLYSFFGLIFVAASFLQKFNTFSAQYIKQTAAYCFLGFAVSLLIPICLIKFKIIQIHLPTSEMQQINDQTKQMSIMKSEFIEQSQ